MVVRYRSPDEDSGRWAAVTLRPGDVIVSTRSKHGTTWVQAIVLMLVHGVELPAPLADLAPWVDHLGEPIEAVATRLAAQDHRRVMKSHTPLDGLPDDPRVHRVVVARHPLDAAVSLYHQGDNIDRERLAAATGVAATGRARRPPLRRWLHEWVHDQADPRTDLDSLDGVLHHLRDAWGRRGDPGVTLVHYADLRDDLDGSVRRLAEQVGLPHDPAVTTAASFEAMRARATTLAPDTAGVLRDRAAFFRGGRSGDGVAAIDPDDLAHYRARVRRQVEDGLAAWLHR